MTFAKILLAIMDYRSWWAVKMMLWYASQKALNDDMMNSLHGFWGNGYVCKDTKKHLVRKIDPWSYFHNSEIFGRKIAHAK